MNLIDCDWGISPTFWQNNLHPADFHHKISVIHDGIDVDYCKPNPDAVLEITEDLSFRPGDEVVTYIARNFEPYRGFPTFMKAVEIIQKERPNCHIVAVGADEVSYGRKLKEGQSWRSIMSEQIRFDDSRLHFLGTLPYAKLITLFQISGAHIYLTYPFVLSWSALESMACGVAMISSDTAPVKEVITDGENGLLVDFFSPEQVAEKVSMVLDDKDRMQDMRNAARQTVVDKYALSKLLPLHVGLVKDLARGGRAATNS